MNKVDQNLLKLDKNLVNQIKLTHENLQDLNQAAIEFNNDRKFNSTPAGPGEIRAAAHGYENTQNGQEPDPTALLERITKTEAALQNIMDEFQARKIEPNSLPHEALKTMSKNTQAIKKLIMAERGQRNSALIEMQDTRAEMDAKVSELIDAFEKAIDPARGEEARHILLAIDELSTHVRVGDGDALFSTYRRRISEVFEHCAKANKLNVNYARNHGCNQPLKVTELSDSDEDTETVGTHGQSQARFAAP